MLQKEKLHKLHILSKFIGMIWAWHITRNTGGKNKTVLSCISSVSLNLRNTMTIYLTGKLTVTFLACHLRIN